jgi:hypothetical protein
LLSAPDFLPLVDQLEMQRWAEETKAKSFFRQGGPEPLCDGRDLPPNPALEDPLDPTKRAFSNDGAATMTAVVGPAARGNTAVIATQVSRSTSWMPDAASDVFRPGWDTSQAAVTPGIQAGEFYANYGLGSPFPEDAKLCAALNSFWPAAAPDVGRTFGAFTALPHLDEELGFHPRHPRVLAEQVSSRHGWDGEFGPFFQDNDTKINFARISRSDYTLNAVNGLMRPDLLQQIDAVEQITRMEGYRDCVVVSHVALQLHPKPPVSKTPLRLITAEKVDDWSARPNRLDPSLTGHGYLFVFARLQLEVFDIDSFESEASRVAGTPQEDKLKVDPLDKSRFIQKVRDKIVCQFTRRALAVKVNNQAKVVRLRPLTG